MAAAIPAIAEGIVKYGPLVAEYGPKVLNAIPGILSSGKKLANFLFTSKGRSNIGHMLSTAEGRGKILNSIAKGARKGIDVGSTALQVGNRLGVINSQQLQSGQSMLGKGHQSFQSSLGKLSSYPGMV